MYVCIHMCVYIHIMYTCYVYECVCACLCAYITLKLIIIIIMIMIIVRMINISRAPEYNPNEDFD